MAKFLPGDPLPLFEARSRAGPAALGQLAGRWLVLCFPGCASEPRTAAMLARFGACRSLFDDEHMSFVAMCRDAGDLERTAALDRDGIHFLDDGDGVVAALYGVTRPQILVIDHGLRLFASIAIDDPATDAERTLAALARLPRLPAPTRAASPAPVLLIPRVFEPSVCSALIAYFESQPSVETGVMSQTDEGLTVHRYDHAIKRRRDCPVQDDSLAEAMRLRLVRRVLPAVRKAFGFAATRIERYAVVRYDAAEGGYFGPHRDNVLPGTAHRRFGVTINLNSEAYDGGDLRFPEFDHRVYRAPTGGAIVFSASLLHEVQPITRGRRYACLPFLYDEEGASQRVRNAASHADPELRAIAAGDQQQPGTEPGLEA